MTGSRFLRPLASAVLLSLLTIIGCKKDSNSLVGLETLMPGTPPAISWTTLPGPHAAQVNVIIATPAGTLFAGTEGGIFKSTDDGVSWTAARSGLASKSIQTMVVNSQGTLFAGNCGCGAAFGVLRSTDNGASWTAVTNGLGSLYITALAVDAAGTLYAGTLSSGVYRSTDNGTNWSAVASGLTSKSIRALVVAPTGTVIAATPDSGLYRSADHGATWTVVRKSSGSALGVSYYFGLATCPTGGIFGGDLSATYCSTDDGKTWSTHSGTGTQALAISAGGVIVRGTVSAGVQTSSDQGLTWVPANAGLIDNSVYCVYISSTGSVFIGTSATLYRASAIGGTWSESGQGMGGNFCSGFAVKGMTDVILSTYYSGMFRSTDHGANWTRINSGYPDLAVWALAQNSSGTLYASNGTGVYRSTNRGASWTLAGTVADIHSMIVGTNGELYGATDEGFSTKGILRSTDDGATWTKVHSLSTSGYKRVGLCVTKNGYILSCETAGIFRSTDLGTTWTPVVSSVITQPVNKIIAAPSGTLIAVGSGAVYRSTDQGATWSHTFTDASSSYLSVTSNSQGHLFAGGIPGALVRSIDDGLTWTPVNAGFGDAQIDHLAADGEDYIYAGTYRSGVLRTAASTVVWQQ
jgi:photosystem II stability/assembly factor-like uncharacterized protein